MGFWEYSSQFPFHPATLGSSSVLKPLPAEEAALFECVHVLEEGGCMQSTLQSNLYSFRQLSF